MVYYIEILSFVGLNMYIMFTFNFQILLYIYSYIPLLTANIFKNTEWYNVSNVASDLIQLTRDSSFATQNLSNPGQTT